VATQVVGPIKEGLVFVGGKADGVKRVFFKEIKTMWSFQVKDEIVKGAARKIRGRGDQIKLDTRNGLENRLELPTKKDIGHIDEEFHECGNRWCEGS